MKVDFGIHVKGRIVDSAFTMSWNPAYENLLKAAQDATNTGVKASTLEHFPGTLERTLMPVLVDRMLGLTSDWASLVVSFKRLWSLMKL